MVAKCMGVSLALNIPAITLPKTDKTADNFGFSVAAIPAIVIVGFISVPPTRTGSPGNCVTLRWLGKRACSKN